MIACQDCALCGSAASQYDWSRVCCRARFIAGLPAVILRRGWMQRWQALESAGFYADIERAVRDAWKAKNTAQGGKADPA